MRTDAKRPVKKSGKLTFDRMEKLAGQIIATAILALFVFGPVLVALYVVLTLIAVRR